MKTVVALYEDFDTARNVVEELVDAGFMRDRISLVASDASGQYKQYVGASEVMDEEDVSGGEGAGFGAVVGGLIGLGAMLIPGVGPVIAAGPLVAGLTGAAVGAVTGAVTGGIVGSLVNMGVNEDEAGYYAEGVRRGGALVTVQIDDNWESRVVDVMSRHRPVDIRKSAEEWRQGGWTGFDASSTEYGTQMSGTQAAHGRQLIREGSDQETHVPVAEAERTRQRTFESYDTDWRAHYEAAYGSRGLDYTYYEPGYQYGYTLATDPRYSQYRTWSDVEPYARHDWETRGQGAWEDFKDSVEHAWNRIRNAVS